MNNHLVLVLIFIFPINLWAFNPQDLAQLRSTYVCKNCDLSQAYLTNIESKIDVTGSNLSKSFFYKCTLDHSNFTNTNMESIKIYGSCNYCNFDSSNLTKAVFDKGDFTYSNFTNATLYRSHFSKQKLDNSDFTNATLHRADFYSISLRNANFTHANFKDALLWNADFYGANFTSADLTGAKIDYANFSESNISDEQLAQTYKK